MGQQRDQVEIINIKLSHRVQYRKNDTSQMKDCTEKLQEENEEFNENVESLKLYSTTAHFTLDKQAEKIAHYDRKHEVELKIKMNQLNDEKDEYAICYSTFIDDKKQRVSELEKLKLEEKKCKDMLDD